MTQQTPQAKRIVELRRTGATYAQIAEACGISESRVSVILGRWAPELRGQIKSGGRPRVVADPRSLAVRRRAGEPAKALAAEFGISCGRVYAITRSTPRPGVTV